MDNTWIRHSARQSDNGPFFGLDHVVGHLCHLRPRQKRLQTKGLEHPKGQPSS
jgi:hypothetical protein